MNKDFPHIPEEYIVPLNMNGLRGRLLRMPPPKNKRREVLIIYGHHSSLERMYSLAQVVNDYGGVTMPDLPGFGGMDSFYKIGERPTIDTMADYLASIVKLRFKNKRFTLAGLSYGFVIVTRMLQRYPDIAKQVELLISIVGFAHKEDFTFSKQRYFFYLNGARFFSHRLTAPFFKNVILHPTILKSFYHRTHNAKHKFKDLSPDDAKVLSEFETHLWRINDTRTHWATNADFLQLNNCNNRVDLELWHVGVKMDNYFDNRLVEQHMRVIFNDFHYIEAPIKGHMPNVIAGKEEAAKILPRKLRQLLNKQLK